MFRAAIRFASVLALATTLAAGPNAVAQSPAAAKCADCGVVKSVNFVQEKGKSSGVGAVAGGVLGGVIGHQIGGGTGKTVATIAGAAGGAYVGNTVEKNKNAKAYWSVVIRMDNGQQRSFVYSNQPTVREGEHVKLIDGGRRLALLAN